jgi:hypothetical protein
MAKLATFFRRIFNSITSDDDYSPSESRKNIVVMPPLTPTFIHQTTTNTSQSCSASPQPSSRLMMKQTTIQVDSDHYNAPLNSLSSNIRKPTNRRLSAPLIIHASTLHRKHRSAIVDESIEKALISPLQRPSLSSTTGTSVHHNNSAYSLGTSDAASANASPRHDARSASFNLSSSNSINLPSSLNNISPASGRC